MKRAGYNFLSRPYLDELPQIHHSDSRCYVPQHRNAVRSEQVGHAELLLKVEEEIEDLRLHGDVERRHRPNGQKRLANLSTPSLRRWLTRPLRSACFEYQIKNAATTSGIRIIIVISKG